MYAKYTGFFRTRRENHNLIKFSPFYRGRGPQKILLYFWGEGANEQKTNKRIKISLFGQKQDLRRVRAFVRTCQETSRGPHKILVLVGLNGIKILPFWERYNLIKFSPFWGELIFKHPNGCFFVGFFRATRFTSFRAKIRGPRGILCTRGEKVHTSKRVSIIACNNVISKVQCAPRTLGFFRTRRENHNLIKFSPFW